MVALIGIAAIVTTVTLAACCKSQSWFAYFNCLAGIESGCLKTPEHAGDEIVHHEMIPDALVQNIAL